MRKLFLTAFASLTIVAACDKKIEEDPKQSEIKSSTGPGHHAKNNESKSGDHEASGLELDNGRKWDTNAEMLPFIQKQDDLINGFDEDSGDYNRLATDLSAANDQLIKNCTMQGKSHDQLHIWLTSHLNLIDQLANAGNIKEASQITDLLEDSMDTYHRYFK